MASAPEAEETASRRKSGRVIRKPELFADEEHSNSILSSISNKRKRMSAANGDGHSSETEDDDEHSDVASDDENDDAGDEEVKEQRKKQRRAKGAAKPAAKRPKTTNGTSTTLAIRSAAGPRKPLGKSTKAAKARSRPSAVNAAGLYAVVFGRNNPPEDAASEWHESLQEDNVAGIRDLVNFILECVNCQSRIASSDIEDIDNVPSRLGDILEEYAHQTDTDYALSSKLKPSDGFKVALTEFFMAALRALHNSGLLYDEPAVYDNIHIWTATMSGASYRPFRHIATIISLSMTTALCQIAQTLQDGMATTKTQIEAEKKKKSTNRARVSKLQEEMTRDETRLTHIDELLRDGFDTVYVHRYRDVDERIRVECATALGNWILLYRKMFLEGQYLRYLGWVLSDPNAPTRLEVVRALKGLFKSRGNIGALRAFTDRFRPRIVEMGSRDTDNGVRAEAIELLDKLRNAELLEPDDIDTVGSLIFDNESRVRKAVSKFFVSNINDLYRSSIEDFDEEQFASTLPTVEEADDFADPCQLWIKFKCLATMLASHNAVDELHKAETRNQDVYGTEDNESRYMLATQSIYPYMDELQNWESLAGYLLFDHSTTPENADNSDINLAVQAAYKLESGEDMVLLDVLQCCVKLTLQGLMSAHTETKSKRSQATLAEMQKKQEAAANDLTLIIPQLLSKFGSAPQAAASILRLEQLLNIDMISDLQPGEGSYINILEDINKQFISHNDRKVLTEASKAFRAARTYETSQDAVDAKVLEIWTESKEVLASSLQGKNVSARGTLDRTTLRGIGDVLGRLAQLAAVSDCAGALESRLSTSGGRKSKSRPAAQSTLLDMLLQLIGRGAADQDTTEQFEELEDRVTTSILTIFSFYFRWRVVSLKTAIEKKDTKYLTPGWLANLAMQRSNFVEAVLPVVSTRLPSDAIRVMSLLTLLDIFTLFATVRHMRPAKGTLSDEIQSNLNSLTTEVPKELVAVVMETHEQMEKRLARKAKKRIDVAVESKKKRKGRDMQPVVNGGTDQADDDVEKPPEDSEDEGSNASGSDNDGDDQDIVSDEDEHATGAKGREARKQAALIAEQALCEFASKLVLASIAGVINRDGTIKSRLQLNRSRLGKSYTQVIAYLDEKKAKSKDKPTTVGTATAQKPTHTPATRTAANSTSKPRPSSARKHLSEALVLEDDDIEDDAPVEEGDDEDLRRRGLQDDDDVDNIDDADEANENERNDGDGEGEDEADDVMGD